VPALQALPCEVSYTIPEELTGTLTLRFSCIAAQALIRLFANRYKHLLVVDNCRFRLVAACRIRVRASGRLWTAADGSFGVDKVALPRVYHLSVVVQLKGTDLDARDDATVLQKYAQRPHLFRSLIGG
jgi:hypothetical protein